MPRLEFKLRLSEGRYIKEKQRPQSQPRAIPGPIKQGGFNMFDRSHRKKLQLYPDDLERLEWYIEDAMARVPLLGTSGISRVINGS